jgi:AraC-like DNA-binding protein
MYLAGATQQEVGDAFDLKRDRVRQILHDAGIQLRSNSKTAEIQRQRQIEAARDQVCAAFKKSHRMDEVATQLGLSLGIVREIVKENFSETDRRSKKPRSPTYSDKELLEFLREANTELEGILGAKAYNEFARQWYTDDGRPWPTYQTHIKRFGSWRAALQAAGLKANPPSPMSGHRSFDSNRCVKAIRTVEQTIGKTPTAAEYDQYARDSEGTLPSLATVRNRCGSWSNALQSAEL